MAKATLTQRVEVLEHKVNGLATLPARVGAVERELKDFRADVHAEFAKVHADLTVVRTEIREGDEETRRYMRVLYEELIGRIRTMGEGIDELRGRS
jgi:hypothetical protein